MGPLPFFCYFCISNISKNISIMNEPPGVKDPTLRLGGHWSLSLLLVCVLALATG